jgi:hypothetical protein
MRRWCSEKSKVNVGGKKKERTQLSLAHPFLRVPATKKYPMNRQILKPGR